jgi:hypothetical protein
MEWALNSPTLKAHIDMSAGTGVVGHSMGGGATIGSASNATAIADYDIRVAVAQHPAPCMGCNPKIPILYMTGDADTVVNPESVLASYTFAHGVEKSLVENHGNTHIDACGWSWLPRDGPLGDWCPQSGPLGRYCTGPNNEDVYVYDWLNCKLKGDTAACTRVTSCKEPGNTAVKCMHQAGAAAKSDDGVAVVGITFSRPIRCNASGPCDGNGRCDASGPCPPSSPSPASSLSPPSDAVTTMAASPTCRMASTVGCFQWPRLDYLAGFYPTFKGQNKNFTQEVCATACCAAGYGSNAVSAVALHPKMHGGPWALMGADCYCATVEAFSAVFASAWRNSSECDQKCPGNKSQSCGGAPLGAQQRLLVSRATCQNCAAAPVPPTPAAAGGVRPIVGADNVHVKTGICCLWDGKCRARCPSFPHCHVHDVPNSVNASRTEVFRNWSTQVTTAIVANANDYPQAHEGANENAACLLADNRSVFTVMRLGAGDYGGYYSDYLQSRSTDTGRSWSKPSFIMGAGSADPKLLRVGGSLILSGGRNCNNINKTIDGVKRGADLMLWLNDDGMANHWTMHSLSYWHNTLWMNTSMVDWRNCTRRGPNCFSPGLNTSCRTETSAYTALTLDANDTNSGWVKYDMHGIPFAMRFVLKTDDVVTYLATDGQHMWRRTASTCGTHRRVVERGAWARSQVRVESAAELRRRGSRR